jgi:CHASE2 domain-containing sensor protein
MEYIRGKPLDEYLAGANLDLRSKMALFARICDGVAHAHSRDVTHRDLKPGNILVDARGEPHVLDFGLAKSPAAMLMNRGQRVTMTSQFLGTLAYSAPEQGSGDPDLPDRRTDVYALGVVLYEMLTGALPYKLPVDLEGTLRVIRETVPRAPSELDPSIERDLDTIVLRALAKEPARRYQSADDLRRDVQHWLADEPIAARRDSGLYLLRTQARRVLRRHKAPAMAAAAALALGIGLIGALALNRLWPAPAVWYERLAMSFVPPRDGSTAFDNTRVIAITDETAQSLSELGIIAQLSGVDSQDWVSSRRLHGWLMQRLAGVGVRGVAWDFAYASDTPYDGDFANGVQALLANGAGAAAGIETWGLNHRGEPATFASRILDAGVLWGGVTAQFPDANTAKMNLVVQHPRRIPTLSLSLAALSIWTQPGAEPVPELDLDRRLVTLRFRPQSTTVMQALPDPAQTITLSGVRKPIPFKDEDAADMLEPDSWIGDYVVRLPDDATFERITRTYHDLVRANQSDTSDLDQWARGRLVIVGDFRGDGAGGHYDQHESADGARRLFGSLIHAAAIDSLIMNAQPARYPRDRWYAIIVAICAALGVILALSLIGAPARRLVLVTLAGVIVVAVCLFSCRLSGYLCNPTGPLMALAAGFALWFLCEPYSHSRSDPSTHLSRSAAS